MPSQSALFDRLTQDLPTGQVTWLGVRPARRQPMTTVPEAYAIADLGLEGDRRCQGSPGSARQITFINAEHLDLVASWLQTADIDPALLRRNVVISGVNLLALRHQQFTVGDAVFEATALCHPCSRMDEALGPGGQAAMLGHGGLCARILKSGMVRVGDSLRCLMPEERWPSA
ncbi:sulfurase [Bacterioplanes sanyensis]|uniref:Sulfurase n=1 Tax=Bacterioplanes sanyensis TaxID=1249553 RepID=A0A222FID5_9GAMM|nr:MOSC domain-containing protein [Bacterioplanes sanyensis]ASP38817.1 sulfurase [Bacterioplanes sanyensis]